MEVTCRSDYAFDSYIEDKSKMVYIADTQYNRVVKGIFVKNPYSAPTFWVEDSIKTVKAFPVTSMSKIYTTEQEAYQYLQDFICTKIAKHQKEIDKLQKKLEDLRVESLQ